MTRALATHACLSQCHWRPTAELDGSLRLFACQGCGSEWTAGQAWTPCDADGKVPSEVRAEQEAHPAH